MDTSGNIYNVEQMRRELGAMGEADPRRAELERQIAEDEGRLDGYLKGRSEKEQLEAIKRMQEKFEAHERSNQ